MDLIFDLNLGAKSALKYLAVGLCYTNSMLCGRSMAGYVLSFQVQNTYHYMHCFLKTSGAPWVGRKVATVNTVM